MNRLQTQTLAFVALFSAAFLFVPSCNRQGGIASVNGEPISVEEFYEYLESKPTVVVSSDNRRMELPVADTLAFQAVRDVVNHKLLVQMAREEKLEPTEKEIDAEIDLRGEIRPGFITSMKSRGLTMNSIRRLVKTEMCQFRLQTVGVTTTDQEVEDFIAKNKDKFVQPEVVEVYWILANSEAKMKAAQDALSAGQPFKSVAKQLSDEPGASRTEGLYPISQTSQIPATAREPISKLQAGQTSDWIKGEQGYAKFMLVRRIEAKPFEMNAARKTYVKRQLMLQKGSQGNDLNKRLAEKLKASKTEVTDSSLKEFWKRYEDKLRTTESETKVPTTTMEQPSAPEPSSTPEATK